MRLLSFKEICLFSGEKKEKRIYSNLNVRFLVLTSLQVPVKRSQKQDQADMVRGRRRRKHECDNWRQLKPQNLCLAENQDDRKTEYFETRLIFLQMQNKMLQKGQEPVREQHRQTKSWLSGIQQERAECFNGNPLGSHP